MTLRSDKVIHVSKTLCWLDDLQLYVLYSSSISVPSGPEAIKQFMLNSAEHGIFPAHKSYCWHFNIYEQEK